MDVDFEARRYAAAFGIEGWNSVGCSIQSRSIELLGRLERWCIKCLLDLDEGWYLCIEDAEPDYSTEEIFGDDEFIIFVDMRSDHGHTNVSWLLPAKQREGWNLGYNAVMLLATTVFRLGFPLDLLELELAPEFDIGSFFSQHEKLELRLSMPREFWPRNWLDQV